MLPSAMSPGAITLAGPDFDPAARESYAGLQAAVPLLTGFTVPIAALALVRSSVLQQSPALMGCLIAALFLATVLFLTCLIFRGEMAAAIIEPGRRQIALVHQSAFARTTWHVDFAKIAELRSVIQYDSYGRKRIRPEMELVSGRKLALPADIGRGDLEAARVAIAQHRAALQPAGSVPKRRPLPRPGQRAA